MAERVYPAAPPVTLGRGLVASSFQYYLTGDEALRVTSFNRFVGATVDVSWRAWREATREIKLATDAMVGVGLGTTTTKNYALDPGALLNLRLGVSSSAYQLGDLWVRAQLIQGFSGAQTVIGTLLQGYISAQNDLAWPGSPLASMHDGRGVIRKLTFGSINGGTALAISVPAGVRWRIVCGRFSFTTSAVAGNRTPDVRCADTFGSLYWLGMNGINVGPSASYAASFGAGMPPSGISILSNQHLPWPDDLELSAGDLVEVFASGIQAGDAFSSAVLIVREWMDL